MMGNGCFACFPSDGGGRQAKGSGDIWEDGSWSEAWSESRSDPVLSAPHVSPDGPLSPPPCPPLTHMSILCSKNNGSLYRSLFYMTTLPMVPFSSVLTSDKYLEIPTGKAKCFVNKVSFLPNENSSFNLCPLISDLGARGPPVVPSEYHTLRLCLLFPKTGR